MSKDKYYIELRVRNNDKVIKRMYFDTYDEVINYLKVQGKNIFNWGFSRKEIFIVELSNGNDED